MIVETVGRTATRAGPHVNWRPELFAPPGRTPAPVVQFCHGAPGFVVCPGDLPGDESTSCCWRRRDDVAAGPFAKGPGLRHGTAGHGYAFLELYCRTGVARWLARARAFAMHAIAQSERDGPRAHGGRAISASRLSSGVLDGGAVSRRSTCSTPESLPGRLETGGTPFLRPVTADVGRTRARDRTALDGSSLSQ